MTESAPQQATRNQAANLAALAHTQPDLQYPPIEPGIEFLIARDGSLTALNTDRQWYDGCSLPMRAAQAVLKKLTSNAPVCCFAGPTHAAQLCVALQILAPTQAIIAIIPDPQAMTVMLHCADFADAINAHRLWFAFGPDWNAQLNHLLDTEIGLCIPGSFIRIPAIGDDGFDRIATPAKATFAAAGVRRSQFTPQPVIHRSATRRACVIAPSHFRLWDDAGHLLASRITGEADGWQFQRFDPDDPRTASPQALAKSIQACDAVISVNRARSDLPPMAPLDKPWLTFVMTPRVGRPTPGAMHDQLILAYPTLIPHMRDLGWKRYVTACVDQPATSHRPARLALIADTVNCTNPPKDFELSSHQLLWELVLSELSANPTLIGLDPRAYLQTRITRMKIDPATLDWPLFLDRLVLPAYQQSLVRHLIREHVPVDLFGNGWDQIDGCALLHRGTVNDRQAFQEIVAESSVLLHAWPMLPFHPVQLAHRYVLNAGAKSAAELAREFRSFATRPQLSTGTTCQRLSPTLFADLLMPTRMLY